MPETLPPAADRTRRAGVALSVDELLGQQRQLDPALLAASQEDTAEMLAAESETAVETFSRLHEADRHGVPATRPLQARYYESLLPATPPQPGEQFAFEVDLDACSGCKACVAACHSLNGLDEDEAWREVGLLHSMPTPRPASRSSNPNAAAELPVLQHVTTACHHCIDPGCLKGCPVNAYEKDPVTGIVRHLDDQCFGCQYCTLMCPYEVPKYNERLGIVRKCDMCTGRLAAGEAPACVQACPHEAIRIRTVSVAGIEAAAAKSAVCNTQTTFAIPHSPPVRQTVPTTIYKSDRLRFESLEPADLRTPRPAHGHGPLTIMLALTQLGVGGFVAAALLTLLGADPHGTLLKTVTAGGFLLTNIGLAAATLHLGRPHLAFRAVLGWRHSWLSREAIAFGAFMPVAAAAVGVAWFGEGLGLPALVPVAVYASAAVAGLVAVMTSVMIYVAARKPLWRFGTTTLRFLLTTALGGASLAAVATTLDGSTPSLGLGVALLAVVAAKLLLDARAVAAGDPSDVASHSAILLRGPLRRLATVRLAASLAGLLLAIVGLAAGSVVLTTIGTLGLFAGELIERWLFFTAVAGPKMPGGQPR